MHDVVEVIYEPNLVAVLDGLGIRWQVGHQSNGSRGTIRVALDAEADRRLEEVIGSLSDLRWQYEPGRQMQLTLDLGQDN